MTKPLGKRGGFLFGYHAFRLHGTLHPMKTFYMNFLEVFMPNDTFKRWTADDIAKLKNLAQKQTRKAIAGRTGAIGVRYGGESAPPRGITKSTIEKHDASGRQDGLIAGT